LEEQSSERLDTGRSRENPPEVHTWELLYEMWLDFQVYLEDNLSGPEDLREVVGLLSRVILIILIALSLSYVITVTFCST